MLIRDLIKQLEELEANCPDYLQPAEIMIDVFEEAGECNSQESGGDHRFVYRGFSKNVRITRSADGVYDILTAFVEK